MRILALSTVIRLRPQIIAFASRPSRMSLKQLVLPNPVAWQNSFTVIVRRGICRLSYIEQSMSDNMDSLSKQHFVIHSEFLDNGPLINFIIFPSLNYLEGVYLLGNIMVCKPINLLKCRYTLPE